MTSNVLDPERRSAASPAVIAYLDRCRRAEDTFLVLAPQKRSPREWPKPIAFLQLHAKQFFWTVRRCLGLDPLRPQRRERIGTKHLLATRVAPQRAPRVLIDVSYAATSPLATGIQRVVRECARSAVGAGLAWPVVVENGVMSAPYDGGRPVSVEPGDTLLLLDASWNRLNHLLPLLSEVKANNGRIVACLYDLVPLHYPSAFADELVTSFERWFNTILPLADAILTNSLSVARDVRETTAAAGLPIAVFPLGCEASTTSGSRVHRETLQAFKTGPTFLSVGTIEPRKGYPVALDAFETLWKNGSPARYVILGRTGWRMAHFERLLRDHPENGKRLVWLRDAGDADLAYAYAKARALIAPSIAEGFGLPIVEAARAGLPVIMSNIEVFREIGTLADGTFFAVADPDDLARYIKALCGSRPRPGSVVASRSLPSWHDATATLMAMVRSPLLYRASEAILTPEDFERS